MEEHPSPIHLTSTAYGKMDADVLASDLTLASKVVWAALRRFENDKTGQCNPSRQALSKATNLSPFPITKAIAELEKRGLLQRQKQGNKSTQYVLQKSPKSTSPEGKEVTLKGVRKLPCRGLESYPPEGKEVTLNTTYTMEKTIEKTNNPAPARTREELPNPTTAPPEPPPVTTSLNTSDLVAERSLPDAFRAKAAVCWSTLSAGQPVPWRNLKRLVDEFGADKTQDVLHTLHLQGHQLRDPIAYIAKVLLARRKEQAEADSTSALSKYEAQTRRFKQQWEAAQAKDLS